MPAFIKCRLREEQNANTHIFCEDTVQTGSFSSLTDTHLLCEKNGDVLLPLSLSLIPFIFFFSFGTQTFRKQTTTSTPHFHFTANNFFTASHFLGRDQTKQFHIWLFQDIKCWKINLFFFSLINTYKLKINVNKIFKLGNVVVSVDDNVWKMQD